MNLGLEFMEEFKEGDLVSIVGQSTYKTEAHDAVILGFHNHVQTGERMYRVGFNKTSEILASMDCTAHTFWGGVWRIVPRVEAHQTIELSLVAASL